MLKTSDKMTEIIEKVFIPNVKELQSFASGISNNEIKEEPILFNCDLQFAYENGGAITKSFIDNLPDDWKLKEKVSFTSRVHLLMPEWNPAFPNWHCDGYPSIPTESILGLVNADISPTQFVLTECLASYCKLDGSVLHKEIEKLNNEKKILITEAKDRTLIKLDSNTIHRAVEAKGIGWRWLGRVSVVNHKITNAISFKSMVSIKNPVEGYKSLKWFITDDKYIEFFGREY